MTVYHPRFLTQLLLTAFLCLLLNAQSVYAETGGQANWITTWSASPQPTWDGDFALPTRTPFQFWKQTVRQVARVSLGGDRVSITVSNEYGDKPLVIGEARLARSNGGAGIVAASDRPVTFSGQPQIIVPPGARVISDPVPMAVQAQESLAVSLYLPVPTAPATFHWDGLHTTYVVPGNKTEAATINSESTLTARFFLTRIAVDAPGGRGAVAVFGDSITDGNGSSLNADHRWPDFLAERLAGKDVAVINAGISGARLLSDGMGENALARFERDVLAQPGVKSVIVLMGINDIGWPGVPLAPNKEPVTAEQMVTVYRQLIAQAHTRNVRVIGATLTPFKDSMDESAMVGYYSEDKEKTRQAVNEWIRTSGEFDAVIDFDKVTRDPDDHQRFLPAYDSGDHLHPGDRGYRAMAEAVDIDQLFGAVNAPE